MLRQAESTGSQGLLTGFTPRSAGQAWINKISCLSQRSQKRRGKKVRFKASFQFLEKGEKPAFARKRGACISLRKGRCIGLKGPPYIFATIPGPVDDLIKSFIHG